MGAEDITPRWNQPTLQLGAVVDERFEILSRVGAGGMCTVYAAKHLQLDRQIAFKRLHAQNAIESDVLQRFMREAKIVGTLDHANIVTIYGFGVWEDQPYIAMEFLDGRSLADLIATEGKLHPDTALPIFAQICDALSHAHSHNVAHRDLKPSNIMLIGDAKAPVVKIVDFGIARVLPESGVEMQKLTQTGQVLGTVMYMSPEQCMGIKVDARSDIYSLGCLMFETLSGQPPFQGDSVFEVLGQHATEAPPMVPGVEPSLASVIAWAMNKSPDARPQSAAELKHALLNPQAAEVKLESPSSGKTKDGGTARRIQVKSATIMLAAVAIGVFGVAIFNLTTAQQNSVGTDVAEESLSELIHQAERERERGKYKEAFQLADRARNLALLEEAHMDASEKKDGVHPQIIHIYAKLAEICFLQGDLKACGLYAQHAIDSVKRDEDRQSHDFRDLWVFRAHAFRGAGDHASARNLYEAQLNWAVANHDKDREARNSLWIAQMDAADKNFATAEAKFRRAVELSAPHGDASPSNFHLQALTSFARYLRQTGDTAKKAESDALFRKAASYAANARSGSQVAN